MRKFPFLFWVVAAGLSGCAPTYMADPGLPPGGLATLVADPQAFRGQEVRLGGDILSLTHAEGKSLLSVRHRELDARGYPYGPESGHIFLAESLGFLSPSSYLIGRQVIVTGTVAGSREGRLLLVARDLKLGDYPRWEKYYYPVPREWYDGDPALEYWFTPPHFDPWRGGHNR